MTTPLTALSDPTNVQFELVDDTGFTEDEAIAFLVGADTGTFGVPKITVAAADVHTGAMIALVPTEEDARRLALDGFEEPAQLHLTLVYLGEAKDFTSEARQEIIDKVDRNVGDAVTARAFAVNVFNPDGDEPALVLGVGNSGGEDLEKLRTRIYDDVRGSDQYTVAENHTPWIPHVTLAYSEHPNELLEQATKRVGPVTFDRVRVAFAGENVDVPLGPLAAATHELHLKGKHNQQDHNPYKGFHVVSDVKVAKRVKALETALYANRYLGTNFTHKDKTGVWSRERDTIHREIVDQFYARAADVPNEGRALLLGGNAGAGKSTVITQQAGVDLDRFLKIDPDEIKEELAKRGLIPDIPGDFSPMEWSTLVHRESVRIADMLADRAFHDRKNVIWDGTMADAGLVFNRVKRMDKAGYRRIDGIFVDVSDETSRRRVAQRYRQGLQSWLAGKGLGSRFVPANIQNAMSSADTRHGFASLRKANAFDNWAVYNNDADGQPAKLVSKEGAV